MYQADSSIACCSLRLWYFRTVIDYNRASTFDEDPVLILWNTISTSHGSANTVRNQDMIQPKLTYLFAVDPLGNSILTSVPLACILNIKSWSALPFMKAMHWGRTHMNFIGATWFGEGFRYQVWRLFFGDSNSSDATVISPPFGSARVKYVLLTEFMKFHPWSLCSLAIQTLSALYSDSQQGSLAYTLALDSWFLMTSTVRDAEFIMEYCFPATISCAMVGSQGFLKTIFLTAEIGGRFVHCKDTQRTTRAQGQFKQTSITVEEDVLARKGNRWKLSQFEQLNDVLSLTGIAVACIMI